VLGSYVLVVVLLVVLNFLLPRALPGEPIAALGDPEAATYVGDAGTRAAVERYYGLDRPLVPELGRYLTGLVGGDLGTSIQYQRPVSSVLADRLPWTLLLVGSALALATLAGILAGIHSGWRRERPADRLLVGTFLALDSLPTFFLGSLAAYLLAVKLGWLPLSGARTPFSGSWGPLRQAWDVLEHLLLPAGVLALQFVTLQYLVMRSSMVGELGADHLLLGRAQGLSDRNLKYRYAARNAMIPSVTVLGLQVGSSIVAAIFVESIFAYPGLGGLMFNAVGERDYPLMQGCFLALSLLVVTANLVVELTYRRLDPRSAP